MLFGPLVTPGNNRAMEVDFPTTNRSSQDVWSSRPQPHNIHSARVSQLASIRLSSQLSLSKKPTVIETRFKEEQFSDALDQSNDRNLREYHICTNNHNLNNHERSMLVVNCLKGGALELFLKDIDTKLQYKDAVDKLRTRYNMPRRKLSLQSEVNSLTFDEFVARYQIRNEKECLRRIDE